MVCIKELKRKLCQHKFFQFTDSETKSNNIQRFGLFSLALHDYCFYPQIHKNIKKMILICKYKYKARWTMEKVRVFVIGVVSELQYYDDCDPQ